MGIAKARQSTPSDEVIEISGSRAPPRAPERQRGLWSFLTWPFVFASIATADTFFPKNGHAVIVGEDQDNPVASHVGDQPGATFDHDQPVAGLVVSSDDGQIDEAGTSRFAGAARWAGHSGGPQQSEGPPAVEPHDTDAANIPASGGGGGAGPSDTNASPDNSSTLQNAENSPAGETGGGPSAAAVSSEAIPDLLPQLISVAGTAESLPQLSDAPLHIDISAGDEPGVAQIVSPELALVSGGISNGFPYQIAIGASSGGGLNVEISIGNEPALEQTTSNVVSAVSSGLRDVASSIEFDTPVSLKDVLGFDLRVNDVGGFVANDLSTALDEAPSTLVADVVSTAASPVTPGLSLVDFGASTTIDDLLGGKGLLEVGHPGNVTPDLNSLVAIWGDSSDVGTALEKVSDAALTISAGSAPYASLIGSATSMSVQSLGDSTSLLDVGHANNVPPEVSNVLASSSVSYELGNDVSGVLETVNNAASATSPDSGSNTASTVSDVPHVSIVGEATDMTPGHSIDFPAQPTSPTDVLFSGNSYTEYHVTLQSEAPSVVGSSSIATATSTADTAEAASLSHVDAPAVSHSAALPTAPEHQDAALTPSSSIQATSGLDELSVRGLAH
jgi:hypothetical protein